MNHRLIYFLTALLSLPLFSSAIAAQKYAIHLDYPEKSGSRYHLSASCSQTSKYDVMVADKLVQTNTDGFTLELSADVTILEVNAAGWATRKTLTVVGSQFIRANSTGPLLPVGTVVVVSIQNGKTTYQVDGKPVADSISQALGTIISLHVSSIGNDDLFGTTSPKQVGDTWNVDLTVVRRLLAEMNAKADHAEITGVSKLEKAERGHLTIQSLLSINNAFLPTPSGFTPESGEIRTEATGRYPISRALNEWSEANKYTIRMVDTSQLEDGGRARLVTEFKTTSQFEISPLASH